jgi:hypothetical protein
MTALDDAMNSSSIVLGRHPILAYWRETSNTDILTNPDAVGNLTDQHDGTITAKHSLDDGLPDPVTMTTGNESAGILSAGMNGREGLTLASSGQRAYSSTGLSSAAATRDVVGLIPNTVGTGDFLVCAVLVNDSNTILVQTQIDPKQQWKFIGTTSVGASLAMHVFTAKSYNGKGNLMLSSDVPVNYISLTTAFWAANPMGYPLAWKVTNTNLNFETFLGTSHTVRATLQGRGYQLGLWGSTQAVGPWSYPSGGSEWGESAQNGLDLMLSTSPFRESGSEILTGVTTSSTSVAILGTISIEPFARPRQNARQYFSPFNEDSPVFGYDRDTADVLAQIRVITASGAVDTDVFNGQMQDLPITGSRASLEAVSRTRINLNRTVTLPIVSGPRENCGVDWLSTWLMARGGAFVGAAPNQYTRAWWTMYGSVHSTWGAPTDYNAVFNWQANATPTGSYGTNLPPVVVGPNGYPAMFAQQTATRTDEIYLRPVSKLHTYPVDEFPHLYENGGTGPVMADLLSLTNTKGRISFWIRGDPALTAPAYLTSAGGNDWLFEFHVEARNRDSGILAWVRVTYGSNTRQPSVQMGSSTGGFGSVNLGSSFQLPTDGQWHFFAFWYDYAAGKCHAKFDGFNMAAISTYFFDNGWNYTAELPNTDAELRASGGKQDVRVISHLPVSDILFDAGNPIPNVVTGWNDLYPVPAAPGGNAVARPTFQHIRALAETTAVNAWDTLTELARSSLSAYRCDETDAMNFLPLGYFGETAQMTPVAVQSTSSNTAELDVVVDNSKIRNAVTVKFPDTRVDSTPQPVLQYSTGELIPPGTSYLEFPLDVPAVEIHGAALTDTGNYLIATLDAATITAGIVPNNKHFITVNDRPDATGTVLTSYRIIARIASVGAQSIVIKFMNFTKKPAYLINNAQQFPFLQILGYGVRSGDGYVMSRDTQSIAVRRERGLETDLPWVQTRDVATDMAGLLVGYLAQPRAELGLTVVGDPRRKPGQLITVADAEGTQADGTWRVLSVQHNINGPEYTQDLQVIQQYPAATWGGPNGWGVGVWSN